MNFDQNRHKRKFKDFVYQTVLNISEPKILEFGVSERGMSTELFLEVCDKNNGSVISIDNSKNIRRFDSEKWSFINCRDDNFERIKSIIKDQLFDIIYLDTIHKSSHVEKILYFYYGNLKTGGYFFIDDTSWLTYAKNREKDNFSFEINNYETFIRLLEIHNNNHENIDLEFSFVGTGVAKIKKLNPKSLNLPKKLKTRLISIKNLIRNLYFKSK